MKSESLLAPLAVILAAGALAYTAFTAREDRNAALVAIGVAVLRADPNKEGQVKAAREWAMDLIDANAGGVKFSEEARQALILQPLRSRGYDLGTYGSGSADGTYGGPGRADGTYGESGSEVPRAPSSTRRNSN